MGEHLATDDPAAATGRPDVAAATDRVRRELDEYRVRGDRMFATSSFQTNSVVLLHLLHLCAPEVPVYFIETGYHFAETHEFRLLLTRLLSLDVRIVSSPVSRNHQKTANGLLLFTSDPEYCCHLNKILPLEPIIARHQVWVSGIRSSQTSHRASLDRTSAGSGGIERYHPLIDWTDEMIDYYVEWSGLPRHPLYAAGFGSIGCAPCTTVAVSTSRAARGGRWAGLSKTECGLHLGDVDR